MREASFRHRVYDLVRKVPRGRVATYGQVAAMIGKPRAARAVGNALRALRGRSLELVPWHRVINGSGHISRRDPFFTELQMNRLRNEGVRFGRSGRIDLATTGWRPRLVEAKRRGART